MSYTPKFFTKYGLEFAYFNKFLLYDENKDNIMHSVYQTIYSKYSKIDENQQKKLNEIKEKAQKNQNQQLKEENKVQKSTKNAVNYWYNYLTDLENECYLYMGFGLEIKKMQQKSRAFQNVNDDDTNGEIYYIRNKYLFLEMLYKQYVINFQNTVNTLYWDGFNNEKGLSLAKFIVNGEEEIQNQNPNNIAQLKEIFFKQTGNLQIDECMELALKMNASYLTEIRKYAEEAYPSQLDLTEQIPEIKNSSNGKTGIGKKTKKSKKSK